MIGLAWYAPLGGVLILGAIAFLLAWRDQRRFEALYGHEGGGGA